MTQFTLSFILTRPYTRSHDVGGLPKGKSTSSPLLRYLRLQQVPLEPGFVVTVEPGLYFNAFLFAEHKNSEFVDHDVLARYEYVGGVRIEDNVRGDSPSFHPRCSHS